MITNCKNILVLAPHTDDGELGLGGTISRLIEDGKKVTYVAFSTAQQSVPEGFPKPNHIQLRSKKTGIRKTRDIRGVNTPEKSIRF